MLKDPSRQGPTTLLTLKPGSYPIIDQGCSHPREVPKWYHTQPILIHPSRQRVLPVSVNATPRVTPCVVAAVTAPSISKRELVLNAPTHLPSYASITGVRRVLDVRLPVLVVCATSRLCLVALRMASVRVKFKGQLKILIFRKCCQAQGLRQAGLISNKSLSL
jgi:hypothetical protein